VNTRAYVGAFNFKGGDQQKKVGKLSGGQRNRVHMAKMLKNGGNVLLLDEPTNDLDVETLGALEDALENFAGCAVVISHDRFFLDRLATHILAFEGDSHVEWFEGNFEDYEEDKRRRLGDAADRPTSLAYKKLTTGVPEAVMVAIFGHETSYGTFTGDFDLLRSLATLAYEGRRRDLFEPEFLATLKLLDKGIPREKLVGSWAGATGYPQFLPSVYLRVAKDADGDGVADIWRSQADALASIANYFVDAGWRKGQAWGMAVSVPGTLNRASVGNRLTPPRCPRVFERFSRWMTVAEWRALGVVPMAAPALSDDTLAVLLEPDGPGRTGYLLTSNYEAILDYNCSNFYALSVGLLADGVAK
jgi:lytic murein transglycosylase